MKRTFSSVTSLLNMCNMKRKSVFSYLLYCILVLASLLHRVAPAFFLNGGAALPTRNGQQIPVTDASQSQDLRIRIRTTKDTDLDVVSDMLSRAVVSRLEGEGKGMFDWKKKLDQMLAKAEILSLLQCRLAALSEGKKVTANLSSQLDKIPDLDDNDRLKIVWLKSDRLRSLIEKASKDTGEDNLWKEHNFALTPPDASWLYHIQMTAENVDTQEVVGFCEVAMLSNPLLVKDDVSREDAPCPTEAMGYSPAITNLATSPEFRRKGIASRLLKSAERIVRSKWGYETLGLFVEKANNAAVSLYRGREYKETVTCPGGDVLGELWYMVKNLNDERTISSLTLNKEEEEAEVEAAYLQAIES